MTIDCQLVLWKERVELILLCIFLYVCTQLPEDLNALWAYITFYGGECQLNLNKKVTHLVVKEPKGVSTLDPIINLFPNLDICRFSGA